LVTSKLRAGKVLNFSLHFSKLFNCKIQLAEITLKVDEVIEEFDEKINTSTDVQERKTLRSERKFPKQARKQLVDFIERKQKYLKDFEIFGERNSYSKTDHDATFMRMKDDHMM